MALINCPECEKQVSDRATSCPDCGCPLNATQQNNLPDAKKLLVLAKKARESGDAKNAKRYYDQILTIEPDQWEAVFYSVYFEASECKIINISSAANSVANCIYSVFTSIKNNLDESEYRGAIKTIVSSANTLALAFSKSAVLHYTEFSTAPSASRECLDRIRSASNIYAEIENGYKMVFPGMNQELLDFQKLFLRFLEAHSKWFLSNDISRLVKEIGEADPSFTRQLELLGEIESVKKNIEAIVVDESKAGSTCTVWVLLILGFFALVFGITWAVLSGEIFAIIPGIVILILGLILKSATKKQIKQNIKKRAELIKKRDALQSELDSLK